MPDQKPQDAPVQHPAQPKPDAKPLTETVDGGVYERSDGVKVDANGEVIGKKKKPAEE